MATRKKRPLHSFDIYLRSLEALQANLQRLRGKLSPAGRAIDNVVLMNALLDTAEEKLATTAEEHTPTHDQGSLKTFLDSETMVKCRQTLIPCCQ